MPEAVDLVVVGAGASGSVLAAKAAQAGKSVVILEAGPERKSGDLWSSQIWARRIKWAGPPALTGGKDPIGVAFNSGWGTGGAALHHYACWFRLHPEDFEVKSRFGVAVDWPIAYDDLRPYYDRIQHEVGVSGDAAAEVWRPAGDPYPLPPLPILAQGKAIQRGFAKLGLRTSPLPQAILSAPFNGRPACILDGWCDAGCPIGALANPLAVFLPQATYAGARIVHDSYVSRVLTDARGERATGVEYVDAQGQRQVQPAKAVALAAFAVENPRILLTSASRNHPNGLANGSGLVGVGMMTHISGSVFGMFKDETHPYTGRAGGEVLCQEDYAKNPRRGYVGSYQWLAGLAVKPNDLLGIANTRPDLFGQELATFIETAAGHLASMALVGEDLPNPDNRLTLSNQKSRFGVPLAAITHAFGPDARTMQAFALKQGQQVFKAAGATDVWASTAGTQHILGGTIMGDHPRTSVANSYGQTHDVANLFVLGPGLFPTSGGVNPTFTIHALALRTAEYVVKHWGAIA